MRERQYVTSIEKVLEPGEKATISSAPFKRLFKLDFVIVPDDITCDPETGEARLLFHCEQIVREGKCPANFILNQHSAELQQRYLYKPVYKRGEFIMVGTFENVSKKALRVTIGIVGYVGAA